MKFLPLIVVTVAFVAIQVGCAPKATKEECQATCGKLGSMEMAKAPRLDAGKQLEQVHAAKLAALEKEKADALAKLEQEHAKAKGPKAKLAKDLAEMAEKAAKPIGAVACAVCAVSIR